MKTKEYDLRSAQAKERRRPTLDSTSAASRGAGDAGNRARGLGEPPGSGRGRAVSGAMLHAVAEHGQPAGGPAESAEAAARSALAAPEAAGPAAKEEAHGQTPSQPEVQSRGQNSGQNSGQSSGQNSGPTPGQANVPPKAQAMVPAKPQVPSKGQSKAAAEAAVAGPGEGPGERHGGLLLRATRERRGLSVADVAKKTRIADRWIIAIEEARLDELPAPVFAIGYIRSYARLLGLDPVAIVERFRSQGPQRDNSFWGSLADRAGATPRSLEQAAAKRKYILWTAAFLLLGLAALLAAWLRSRR